MSVIREDIELFEAAGESFAALLRDLAAEHGRVNTENARLLSRLPSDVKSNGHTTTLQVDLAIPGATHDRKERSAVADLDTLAERCVNGWSVEENVKQDHELYAHLMPDPRSPKSLSSSENSDQPCTVEVHYLWTQSVDAVTSLQSGLTRSLAIKLDHSASRGGDIMREKGCLQRLIVGPSDLRRMFWDLLSIIILSVDIVMVPMIAFDIDETDALRLTSLICAGFWTLDMVLSFFTGFHVEGTIEMRPAKVCRNYVRSWFPFDITVVLVDWVLFLLTSNLVVEFAGIFRVSKLLRLGRILRALRLLRLMRLMKMPALLDDLADYWRADGFMVGFRVARALITIAVANHFLACGWYAVGKASSPSWITQLDIDGRDLAFRYASALHWSLTQFTPATMEIYPKSLAERIYAVCVLILALVVFSSFVSSITNAMNHLRQLNEATCRQRDYLRRYILENKLSLALGNRITAFARHLHIKTKVRVHQNQIDALKVLPESLRLQLYWEVYLPITAVHPFFFHCAELFEPFVLNLCRNALSERSLITSQELFSQDEEATEMYFTISGSLEYYKGQTDMPSADVDPEEWCCEVSLWLHWIHKGQLVALAPSELVCLDAHIFRRIVSRVSEAFEVCRTYAWLFYEHVSHLEEVDVALDIRCDQSIALEMAHHAFDIPPKQSNVGSSLAEMHTWRTFSGLSIFRRQTPTKWKFPARLNTL